VKNANLMAIILNLFGGPGSGKTTLAAGIFHSLKILHKNVEIVSEFPKELILAQNQIALDNQFYVTGHQAYRQWSASKIYDYVIMDSPILLGAIYNNDEHISAEFNAFLLKYHQEFDNINIYLKRDSNWLYSTKGRRHNSEEALSKDEEIFNFLVDNNIDFHEIDRMNPNIEQHILGNILKITEFNYDMRFSPYLHKL
jgi:GTPase SAR1 family protein